jgi:hypothetical protein
MNMFIILVTKSRKPDRMFSLFGFMAGCALILLSEIYNLNRTHLGMAISFASLGYHPFRAFVIRERSFKPVYRISVSIAVVETIIFFGILAGSIQILRTSLYHRPPFYFALIALLVIILLKQISSPGNHQEWRHRLILVQIFLLCISIKAGAFHLYPTVLGNDPFQHEKIINPIIQSGLLPESAYTSFPVMHLLAGAFSLISGNDTKTGMFFVSTLHTVSLMAFFPLGKRLFDARAGLLAVLLLGLFDHQLMWGMQIIPMTLGITWFAMVLFCLFNRDLSTGVSQRMVWTLGVIVFSFLIVFTHSLSTLILIISLSTIWLSSKLAFHFGHEEKTGRTFTDSSMPLLLLVIAIAHWMQSYLSPGMDFFSWVIHSISAAKSGIYFAGGQTVSIASQLPGLDVFWGEAGWTLLLIPTLIGVLYTFSEKGQRMISRLVLSSLTLLLLTISYGAGLFGLAAILPARWVPFISIPACLLAAVTFAQLFSAAPERLSRLIVTASLALILFFMVASPTRANPDSPLYGRSLSVRPGFTSSELAGIGYARYLLGGDGAAGAKTRLLYPEAGTIDPRLAVTYETSYGIVLREFDFERGFFIPFPKGQILEYARPTQEFYNHLNADRLRVYDNGTVSIYLADPLDGILSAPEPGTGQ